MAKYSCKNGSCVEDVNGRFTDSNCGGTCSSSSTKKYACKNGSCVEDVNGRFTDSNCGGTCPSNCTTQDKERTDNGFTKTDKVTYDRAKSKTDKYETDYFWCDSEGKHHLFFKSKTTPTTDDTVVITPGGRYRDCTGGPYSKGCTDTEGIIRKVQGCLGTTVDGKFWSNTESALMSKTGKNTFTKEDVSKICSGVSTDGGPLKPFGIEEQKIYWEDLKSEGQITTLGTPLTSTKNNVVVYVYKKNRTTDKKEKITSNEVKWKSSPEIKDELLKSFEVYDYIVLHPINPNTPNMPGEVSIMTAGLNQDDEVVISTVTAGRWAPAQKTVSYDSEESNDLMAETIQKILKGRLIEQNVTLTKHSSPDPTIKGTDIASTSTTKDSGTGTSTTTTKSTTTPKTIDVKVETEKIMTPIKQKALNKIQEWDDYNEGLESPLVRSMGKGKINTEIDKARSIIQSVEPKDFCSNNVKSQINSAMTDINKKKKEYSSILTSQDNKFMSELEALLNDLIVGCETIQTNIKSSEMLSTTIGGTTVSGPKPESTSVSGPKPESMATSELKKEEESLPDCSNSVTMLVEYVISGLQGVTTDQTKINKQKSDLCYCYKTGGFNSMNARTKVGDLFKDKIKSYDLKSDFKTKVSPEKQLFRPLLNRNLGWNEIQKLIQGKEVFKVTINSRYIDRNFGTENCYRTVNESINSKVKRHMTEAIKTKRKDVMVESILKDIKGLRK
jgi:hypothetical protein